MEIMEMRGRRVSSQIEKLFELADRSADKAVHGNRINGAFYSGVLGAIAELELSEEYYKWKEERK